MRAIPLAQELVLLEYDGPQFAVFRSGRQLFVGHSGSSKDEWSLAPVSVTDLRALAAGGLSMRAAFERDPKRLLWGSDAGNGLHGWRGSSPSWPTDLPLRTAPLPTGAREALRQYLLTRHAERSKRRHRCTACGRTCRNASECAAAAARATLIRTGWTLAPIPEWEALRAGGVCECHRTGVVAPPYLAYLRKLKHFDFAARSEALRQMSDVDPQEAFERVAAIIALSGLEAEQT